MADTRRTWAQLAVLYADNTAGAISPQDLRDGFASLQPHVAASAPTVSDDETAGFDTDHAWIDTSTTPDSLYRCLDPSTGAAVWVKVYPATASIAWGAITGTLGDQTDLGDSAGLDVGTTTGTVAAGDHNHSGVYEPADASLLKSAAIGVTVQGYDADLAAIAGLSPADGSFIVGSGSAWTAESGSTARTSLGLGTAATEAATAFATASQGSKADSAIQPDEDADRLGSGDASDGYVLTADGAGGAAWEAPTGGGGLDAQEALWVELGGVFVHGVDSSPTRPDVGDRPIEWRGSADPGAAALDGDDWDDWDGWDS